jgi:hypothetical protein
MVCSEDWKTSVEFGFGVIVADVPVLGRGGCGRGWLLLRQGGGRDQQGRRSGGSERLDHRGLSESLWA